MRYLYSMPYKIEQVPRGYKVFRYTTAAERSHGWPAKKYFSYDPLPYNTAESQLAALYHATDGGHYINEMDLNGSGIGDIFRRVKNVFTGSYSSATEKMQKERGNWIVVKVRVHREPVVAGIKKVLNTISLGKFNRGVENNDYRNLFHLFAKFEIKNPNTGQIEYWTTEKSPSISWVKTNGLESKNQKYGTHWAGTDDLGTGNGWANADISYGLRVVTVGEMLQKAIEEAGLDFALYNGVTNNCQRYIMWLLHACGITALDRFIVQKVDNILTGHTKLVADSVTGLASVFDRILGK